MFLFCAAAGLAQSTPTPPVNLGATGLSLDLRLWHWTDTAGDWAQASTAGVTIVDEGTGEYTVDGLPVATGTERYHVVLFKTGSSTVAVRELTYGASPGRRILWRTELEAPAAPWVFKQNDSHGSISIAVLRGLPATIASATATFTMYNPADGSTVIVDQAASVTNTGLDATSGTYFATLVYDWSAGDLATAGRFRGEWEVTFPDTTKETFPKDDRLRITVRPDFNDG